MSKALTIIHNEHRTISTVLHGLEYLVHEIGAGRKKIDPRVFHAMIFYLDAFSEQMHHPKEDQFLFSALRRRGAGAEALIIELEKEHERGGDELQRLVQALNRYELGGDKAFPAFASAVGRFVYSYREHMRKEEEQLFPLARALLTDADWKEIDRAFELSHNPAADKRNLRNLEILHARIAEIAAPPTRPDTAVPSR